MGVSSVSTCPRKLRYASRLKFALRHLLLCALFLFFRANLAASQTAAEIERARVAYAQGQERYRAGDYQGAQASFEDAYRAVQNPVVLLGIAEALLKQERWSDAAQAFKRYLTARPNAPDRAKVEAQIAVLRKKSPSPAAPVVLPSVTIAADQNSSHDAVASQPSQTQPADANATSAASPLTQAAAPLPPVTEKGISRAALIQENKMSRSYTLVSAIYKIDGKSVFSRRDDAGGLSAQSSLRIFDGELPEGAHQLEVELSYKGGSFGLFSYMRDRMFVLRSKCDFASAANEVVHITAMAYEKGGPLVPVDQRPTLRCLKRIEKTNAAR